MHKVQSGIAKTLLPIVKATYFGTKLFEFLATFSFNFFAISRIWLSSNIFHKSEE